MAYTRLRYHLVFGTYGRHDWIPPSKKEEVFDIIDAACTKQDGVLLRAGGTQNHVHLLVAIPPDQDVQCFVKEVKRQSSLRLPELDGLPSNFSWQRSYSAHTVSSWNMGRLLDYIENQPEHHRSHETQPDWEPPTDSV